MVSGEELELMLQEWDTPLVIDAYATWYVSYPIVHFLICTERHCRSPSGKTNTAIFYPRTTTNYRTDETKPSRIDNLIA
jgi:hypothetical protein